ncbi:MAG TPA: VOC family protein [Chloroflexota bacterium]|jgi:catechol 2,3-dioxygenase-like lactoylglutathione lyase family enzyme
MAEVESISHSGMVAPDSRLIHDWYEEVMGGTWGETVSRDYEGTRGGNAHSCGMIADYLFVTFPRAREMAGPQVLAGGEDSYRHAWAVSRAKFDEALQHLEAHGVEYDGPVNHPENGPLGQSIYFRDAGGNFFEICWRRDEEAEYHPVITASV